MCFYSAERFQYINIHVYCFYYYHFHKKDLVINDSFFTNCISLDNTFTTLSCHSVKLYQTTWVLFYTHKVRVRKKVLFGSKNHHKCQLCFWVLNVINLAFFWMVHNVCIAKCKMMDDFVLSNLYLVKCQKTPSTNVLVTAVLATAGQSGSVL